MLPHPDILALPFKEGIRDLRSSIRFEARAGGAANRLPGVPKPARRLARLADGVLRRAEGLAVRILPRGPAGMDARLDRLGALLRPGGRPGERPADLYAVGRAALDADEAAGSLVSELRITMQGVGPAIPPDADPVEAAVGAVLWTAEAGLVRPCLSTVLMQGPGSSRHELDARLSLVVWLAVLVRLESRADGGLCLGAARAAVEAEGDEWLGLLRRERLGELADAWRQTVPYLP